MPRLFVYEAVSFVTIPREPWAPKRDSHVVSLVGAHGVLLRQPLKEQFVELQGKHYTKKALFKGNPYEQAFFSTMLALEKAFH